MESLGQAILLRLTKWARAAEESDRYRISICEPDEGDGDDDPVSWEKANPNMGVSVNSGMLQDRYDKCKLTESE